MVVKSFKKAGVALNTDGSEDNLFIGFNKDEEIKEMVAEVEEIVAEVDQIVIIEDEEQVDIEIVKEKIDEPYDDSCSIAFAESDDEEEEKGGQFGMINNSKIIDKEESELIEALQEELDEAIFPKRLEDGALHKFYGISQKKRSSAAEI